MPRPNIATIARVAAPVAKKSLADIKRHRLIDQKAPQVEENVVRRHGTDSLTSI